MRAEFKRKEPRVKAEECVIEKVIRLSAGEYAAFTQAMLCDYDFITESAGLMGAWDGAWHCLLVTGEGMEEGVLVQSEGASYARYSSFVPSVSALLTQENSMVHEEAMEEMEKGVCQQMA